MSLGYRLAYRLGLTPWERAGSGFMPQVEEFLARAESEAAPGKALDVGCGTGDHAIELARRGWLVTGVDSVPQAIAKAKDKASAAGVNVTFVPGDVTALGDSVGSGYRLILDVGCFHGLTDSQRAQCASGITGVSAPGSALLLFAFGPGRRGPLPRGVSRADVEKYFAGWQLTDDNPADTSGMPGPLKSSNPRWFRLVR